MDLHTILQVLGLVCIAISLGLWAFFKYGLEP